MREHKSGDEIERVFEVRQVLKNIRREHNRYRLKHPSEVRNVLASLSRFVKLASVVATSDR
jgi:hypothetical protein